MSNATKTIKQSIVLNGVDVSGLLQTIEAVKRDPQAAKFHFQLSNDWISGAHSCSMVNEFQAGGQEIRRARSFAIEAEEPPLLLGEDKAPNPVEYLLAALASCVTTSMVYHAAARGIAIQEIQSKVEGNIDLHGFLGLDDTVRSGFQNIRMQFKIRADVSDEEFDTLAKLGPAFSPVFDSVTKGVPVSVRAERIERKYVSVVA